MASLLRCSTLTECPWSLVRAFADDIAAVLRNLESIPKLLLLLERFAKASGLTHNLLKCQIIPPVITADPEADIKSIRENAERCAPALRLGRCDR